MPKKGLSYSRLIGEGDPTSTNGTGVREDDSPNGVRPDVQEPADIKALRILSDNFLRETVECVVRGDRLSPIDPSNNPALTIPGGISHFLK